MSWSVADLERRLAQLNESRSHYDLTTMQTACARLGHPERGVPCLHIAGTNGKGSTIAFLRAMLTAAGYRVGVYTSPHLLQFAERITLSDGSLNGETLARHAEAIAQVTTDLPLTYFEFATLLAFVAFAETHPDLVLLETGLGGRLDATNVVTPIVSVLTPISRDHQAILGETVSVIAREKCGIIKPGIPVVSSRQDPAVQAVIEAAAATANAALTWAGSVPPDVPLGLAGAHQSTNAGLAWSAAQTLMRAGWRTMDTAALQQATWPGRCEWLSRTPAILFDGAHNAAGAAVLVEYLRSVRPRFSRIECVFSTLADKDHAAMLQALVPVVDYWWHLPLDHPRAVSPTVLCAEADRRRCAMHLISPEALRDQVTAAPLTTLWVFTGSLSLYRAAGECAAAVAHPLTRTGARPM